MEKQTCYHIEHWFGKLFLKWFKDNPSIVKGVFKANNNMDGFLFKNREQQRLIVKKIEEQKQFRLKNMTVEEKLNFLKDKKLI
jgi:hypothetical protein